MPPFGVSGCTALGLSADAGDDAGEIAASDRPAIGGGEALGGQAGGDGVPGQATSLECDERVEIGADRIHEAGGGTPSRRQGCAMGTGGGSGVSRKAAHIEAGTLCHAAGIDDAALQPGASDRSDAGQFGNATLGYGRQRSATVRGGIRRHVYGKGYGNHGGITLHALKCRGVNREA